MIIFGFKLTLLFLKLFALLVVIRCDETGELSGDLKEVPTKIEFSF